jgi:hypothetical protein
VKFFLINHFPFFFLTERLFQKAGGAECRFFMASNTSLAATEFGVSACLGLPPATEANCEKRATCLRSDAVGLGGRRQPCSSQGQGIRCYAEGHGRANTPSTGDPMPTGMHALPAVHRGAKLYED